MIQAPDDLALFLAYDPTTGVISWKDRPSPQAKVRAGDVAGNLHHDGYRCIKFRGRLYLAHRIAWFLSTGSWPESAIDHINGDRSDNRAVNIRLATQAQNGRNKRALGRHGKGVTLERRTGRYVGRIYVDGRQIGLGTFDTPEAAHEAYRAAAVKYHGEFARFE